MPKANSRERIVVGVDAVKKYAQIAKEYHRKIVAVCVSKKVFFHASQEVETNVDIWCDHCEGKFYSDLPSFLKAHGIED